MSTNLHTLNPVHRIVVLLAWYAASEGEGMRCKTQQFVVYHPAHASQTSTCALHGFTQQPLEAVSCLHIMHDKNVLCCAARAAGSTRRSHDI
jgi:hypothetical protein